MKHLSAQYKVWRLLSDGQWHQTSEINDPSVGGSEGCRRVRELRAEIEKGERPRYKCIDCESFPYYITREFKYRLVRN